MTTTAPDSDRIQRLQNFLQQDPDNRVLLADLCDHLIEAGRVSEARAHAQAALSSSPHDPQFRYRLAVIAQREGQLDEAKHWLEGLITEGVGDPVVLMAWGRLQLEMGDAEGAARTLEPLCQPQAPAELRPVAMFLRVRSLHQMGEMDAAIALAEQGLQSGHDFTHDARNALTTALATLYLDAQRNDDAARLVDLARQQGPLNPELLSVGGFLALNQAEVGVARQQFEASLSKAPDLGRAHLGLGLSHAVAGQLAKACAALEHATRTMPTHLGSWHALAWMRLLSHDLNGAQQAFEQALEQNRTFGETHGGLAIVAVLRGEVDAAKTLIRTGRKLDADSLNVNTAELLIEQGGDMKHPDFFSKALKMLHERAMSKDAGMQATFYKLMGRDSGQTLH